MDQVQIITCASALFAGLSGAFGCVCLVRELRGGGNSTESRLKSLLAGSQASSEAPSLLRQSGSGLDRIGEAFLGFATTIISLNNLFEQAGVRLSMLSFLGISAAFGAFGVVAAALLNAPVPFYALAAFCSSMIPLFWIVRRRQVRFARFARQFPDALQMISRALRAGHGLASAMNVVAEEMLPPVSAEFRRVIDEQLLGRPIDQSLAEMAKRIPSEDLHFFAVSVRMQQRCGGNLAEILDQISGIVRERFRILGQVQALTGEGRLSGAILLAMPIAIFVTVYGLSPEYMEPLFNDPLGRKMTAVAAALQLVGAFAIRHIVRIKV